MKIILGTNSKIDFKFTSIFGCFNRSFIISTRFLFIAQYNGVI